MNIVKSFFFFIVAGAFEIGGGYMVWLWLKQDKPLWYGIAGGFILACYGVATTLQTSSFGRVYAAYGGVFIIMALLWAWNVDGFKPDRYDILGAVIALLGQVLLFICPGNSGLVIDANPEDQLPLPVTPKIVKNIISFKILVANYIVY